MSRCHLQTRRRSSPEPGHAGSALTSDAPASRAVTQKCPWLISHPAYGVLLEQPKLTKELVLRGQGANVIGAQEYGTALVPGGGQRPAEMGASGQKRLGYHPAFATGGCVLGDMGAGPSDTGGKATRVIKWQKARPHHVRCFVDGKICKLGNWMWSCVSRQQLASA